MTGRMISQYRILGPLGEGGMGVVYKAEDTQLGRPVALKSLPAAAVADEGRRARFMREARAASALNHPNIITIHDLVHQDGEAFLVMELVDGKTLEALIHDRFHDRGLPLSEVLRLAIPIADALATAHQAGIVHRDLKPGNVMVNQSGIVKVLDFGLAKVPLAKSPTDQDATRTLGHTEDGAILGTVSYMSPEQAQGKPVDARSDIFAFGSVLYEMLTGRKAFSADNKVSTLAALLEKEPVPVREMVPSLPRDVERLLQRCLRKDPAKRWQTMADLKVALEELKEESDSGGLSGTLAPPVAPMRSRRMLWGALATAGVLIAAGAAWMMTRKPPLDEAVKKVVLTTYPGSEISPAISPDGRQIAFSWDGPQEDNFDIYVKMIDSGEPLRLTTDPARDSMPRWSPDGKSIAFLPGNAIYTVAPLGGPERKLTDTTGARQSSLAWRPDGQALLIADQDAIVLFTLADGKKTRLTPPGPSGSVAHSPAYSPDGKAIAYVGARLINAAMELYVMPANGGAIRRVEVAAPFFYKPVFSADGRDLILVADSGGLFRLPVAGGKMEKIALADTEALDPYIAVSPPRLVYSKAFFDSDIWALDRMPAGQKPRRVIASTRRDFAPQVSPDGQRLAFTSDRTGAWEVYASDISGGRQVQLTTFGNAVVEPTGWSPDGKELCLSVLVKGNRDIYLIGSDGGPVQRLTNEPSEEGRARFSRDGRMIYFRSDRSGRAEIWKMPRAGGAAVPVTRDGGFDAQESADGQTLYFTQARATPGLWAMPVAGGSPKKVLDEVLGGWWTVTHAGVLFLDSQRARRRAAPSAPALDTRRSKARSGGQRGGQHLERHSRVVGFAGRQESFLAPICLEWRGPGDARQLQVGQAVESRGSPLPGTFPRTEMKRPLVPL